MADDLTPTAAAQDDAPAPIADAEGLSKESLELLGLDPTAQPAPAPQEGELSDEFKPYSQFPWASMDAETRVETLAKLKKFHGDMSRGTNEAAELRKNVSDLQGKADWLDNLATQPWFQSAYQAQMNGQTPVQNSAPEEPASFNQLNEYGIDADAAKTMDKAVDRKLSNVLAPLAQKLEFLERSMVQDQTDATLSQLTGYAKEQGYPSPDDKMVQLREIIRAGRATNIRDAYMLSISDDVPGVVASKTRADLEAELQRKMSQSIPPGHSAVGAPSKDFSGPDGVKEALAEAKRELASLTGR